MNDWMENLPGREVRGFLVGRAVGEGPRARVFKGEQKSLRRPVALKVLHRDYAGSQLLRNAFLEAGRAAAGLIHPNVIPIVTVVDDGPVAMVVSEFAEYPTLAAALAPGRPLPFQEVCQIALHVLDILAIIHAGRRRHGNLNPANIFAADDGRYRLSDFYQQPVVRSHDAGRGSPMEYVAPEIRLGGMGGPRSDLYSLGMVLLNAASGLPPGAGGPVADAPASFSALVARMAEPHPERRPANAREVLEAVKALRAEARALGGRMAQPARADLPPPNRRRYHRLPADAAVSVKTAYTEFGGADPVVESRLRDIGENGVFVATPTPLPIGALVSLEFGLDGEERVEALGMVRWLARPPADPGMGVQFVEVSYPARESLARYLDDHMPDEARRVLTATPGHRAILKALPALWSRPAATLAEWSEFMHADPGALAGAMEDFVRLGLLSKTPDDRLKTHYPTSRSLLQTLVRLAEEV